MSNKQRVAFVLLSTLYRHWRIDEQRSLTHFAMTADLVHFVRHDSNVCHIEHIATVEIPYDSYGL